METNNKIDTFLKQRMSHEEVGHQDPSPDLVKEARALVTARKRKVNEKPDIFLIVAGFLNFHIRLSYVVVVVLLVGVASLYLTRETSSTGESITSPGVINIASARSSTVLSSIITFETHR